MHPVDSNEISFMLAGRNAFSEAFKNAGPKILEPIYDVEVFVPSDKMGDVMSDLQGRRGMIMGMSSESGYEKLVAKVPLKEMSSYSSSLPKKGVRFSMNCLMASCPSKLVSVAWMICSILNLRSSNTCFFRTERLSVIVPKPVH